MTRTIGSITLLLAFALVATSADARVYPPSNLQATALGMSAIELSWDDVNPDVIGFVIQRSLEPRRNFEEIAIADGEARTYLDIGLESDTTYYYRLRTLQERRSSSGVIRSPRKSRNSSIANDTTFADVLPPPNPTSTPTPTATPSGTGGAGQWSKRAGGSGTDIGVGTAVDASGNVVMVGRFTGSTSFGGAMLSSAGGFDGFVAKYASDGTHLWSKRFGSPGSDQSNDVAVDQYGNVIVVGSFEQNVNFGGGTRAATGMQDVFVAKYAPDGTHLWTLTAGGVEWDQALAVDVDGGGNVVVGGSFRETVSFGGPSLSTSGDNVVDLFVAKYTQDGAHVWSKSFRANYAGEVRGVAADASGRIAVTGFFDGTVDFGGGVVSSYQESKDAFVALLSPTGAHLWSRSFGNSFDDFGEGVAIDGTGSVVVAGRFSVQANFGGGSLQADAAGNVFVAKYASSGAHQWSHAWGGLLDADSASDVAIGAGDAVIVTGSFAASSSLRADFGGTPMAGAGGRDVFVAKYSSGGTHVWSAGYGGSGNDDGMGIAVAPTGNAVAAGTFSGTGQFNAGTLTSAGSLDAFLLKLP